MKKLIFAALVGLAPVTAQADLTEAERRALLDLEAVERARRIYLTEVAITEGNLSDRAGCSGIRDTAEKSACYARTSAEAQFVACLDLFSTDAVKRFECYEAAATGILTKR